MSALADGEICYADGSYYSAGDSQAARTDPPRRARTAPASVREKLAELLSNVKIRPAFANESFPYAFNAAARAASAQVRPDASFAMPMRELYLKGESPDAKLATPRTPCAAIVLPPASSMQLRKTLVGLTPGQIKALSPEEFRACFAATPANALRPAQRLLIEADETLGKIARESLNGKAHKKRVSTASARKPVTLVGLTLEEIKALSPEEFRMCFTSTPVRALTSEQLAFIDAEKSFREAAHAVLNERESKQNSMRVDLPKKLAAFVAQQVETGLYRDASEVVSESLRFFQKQTDMQLLRLTLERETQARIREFEEGRFQADEELLERLRRASSASARGGVRKRRANDLGVTA